MIAPETPSRWPLLEPGDVVPGAAELADGQSTKFRLRFDDRDVECLIVRWRGNLHAWVNRCRHVALEMDWVENRFFDRDGRFLLCQTHCALYEPDTGECVGGPPAGKRLFPVAIVVDDDGDVRVGTPRYD